MHGCAESVEALVLPAMEFRRLTLLRLVTLLRCWFVALLRFHACVTPNVFSVTTGTRVCTGLRELAVRTGSTVACLLFFGLSDGDKRGRLSLKRGELLCVRLLSVGFPHCCELSVPEPSVRGVFLAAAQCKPRLWQWRSRDSSQLGSEAR